MSNFSIQVDKLKNKMNELASISNSLSDIHNKIEHINIQLGMDRIKEPLKGACSQIEGMNNSVLLLKNQLYLIANLYEMTENEIVQMATKILLGRTDRNNEFLEHQMNMYPGTDQTYATASGTTYKLGKPEQPQWEVYKQYDNDFAYDPNEKPSVGDYKNWMKWKILNEGAQYAGWMFNRNMPDAIKAYEHYRSGDGTALEIDYAKAYREDSSIKTGVDNNIRETQQLVENMIADGQKPPFSITSGLIPMGNPYPVTENWQKTIGAHKIWISADITVDENGQIHMDTIVHEIDRYNFNNNMKDIASGASDNENGRFEQLGWAKSYDTIGQVTFDISWSPGKIESGTQQKIVSKGR